MATIKRYTNSMYYEPAYRAAVMLRVAPENYAAFACRIVYAAANGQYYKAAGSLYRPTISVRPWEDCANVAAGYPATPELRHYVDATKPATWDKWRAIAKEHGLQ